MICHLCLMNKYYTAYSPTPTTTVWKIWNYSIVISSTEDKQAVLLSAKYSWPLWALTSAQLSEVTGFCVDFPSISTQLTVITRVSTVVVFFLIENTVWRCYCLRSKNCSPLWCFTLFMVREVKSLIFLLGWRWKSITVINIQVTITHIYTQCSCDSTNMSFTRSQRVNG